MAVPPHRAPRGGLAYAAVAIALLALAVAAVAVVRSLDTGADYSEAPNAPTPGPRSVRPSSTVRTGVATTPT